ncbi:MAG: uracil-DNA glycosylase [Actinoplanes sp.]
MRAGSTAYAGAMTESGRISRNGGPGWWGKCRECCAGPVNLPESYARTAADVVSQAADAASLPVLDDRIVDCFACPRLVAWREEVAAVKRASFRDQHYWGRPLPGFGPADAPIAILGLAPAAHGGNRTGRVFTGDRSGDVLFAALHRAGLANQPTSVAADDGLELQHTRIFAAVRCAPPDNKPTPEERDTCAPWLHRELNLIRPTLRVVVALGAFAWAAWWPAMSAVYRSKAPVPRPKFGHGALVSQPGVPDLLGCFHVSQQNTFTGRLTPAMLDDVFARAKRMAGLA